MSKKRLVVWLLILIFSFVLVQFWKIENFCFDWNSIIGNAVNGNSDANSNEFVGMKYVSKIIDGDTVIIEGESVRLLGMDADEKGYPCWKAAKQRIEELVLNKQVDVIAEKNVNKDQYKRYLRYLFMNETNIDLQLVKEGLAVARTEDSSYAQEFIDAEKIAREDKIGCKWNSTG